MPRILTPGPPAIILELQSSRCTAWSKGSDWFPFAARDGPIASPASNWTTTLRIHPYSFELPGGRRIRFSLMRRTGSPDYFVCFRDAQGHRRELTTGEKAKHTAADTAPQIIKTAYSSRVNGCRGTTRSN